MLEQQIPTLDTGTEQLENDPLWYKDAIIYQLHVKAFFDSNGDGMGDFRGLTEKLDYIQDLGVNTLWLLPFYPSPLRDDGYDIADYLDVHRDYGTMRDFRTFIAEAHRRKLRVITELVINHTSDQHPWFQAARKAPRGSRKRDFYVWSDTYKKYEGTRIIFTDTETSNWTWDNVAQQYYWHRFFSHQPDLNFDNPQVLKAVIRVMRFWFDAGVDGMRLDAIPYLCEREGTSNENLPESHAVLRRIRAELDARYRNRMLLAEANQWPEDVCPYFGAGDECHMAFHFPLMPRIFMAVAQEDRHPIVEIMTQTPDIPDNCQWAVFLRNHDELTLEMVTDKERDYLYQVYAGDPRMRINLGIRRRLAPLVDNDIDRIRLLNNLLLSMPGSPVIYYGDDIGMGDNIFIGDRNGVRTPMQWSPDRNAGFSRADPARLYLPPVMDAVYGYEAVNVEAQARDPFSMLSWMKRVIAVRKAYQAFGRGRLTFLKPGNRKILAYLREHQGEVILCVTNLSRAAQPVELDLVAYKGRVPVEMMGRTAFPPIGEMPYLLTLPGYGFYWFRLAADAEVPHWHEEFPAMLDLPVLVLFAGWRTFFPEEVTTIEPAQRPIAEKLRVKMEQEVWPKFLASQRWFGAKSGRIERVAIGEHAEWIPGKDSWLLAIVRLQAEAESARYFLPLAIIWEGNEERVRLLGHHPLARVRRGPRPGMLLDAFADEAFCWAMVNAMGAGSDISFGDGRLRFKSTPAFTMLVGGSAEALPVRPLGVEQSNSSVILGDRLILKAYRRLQEGINPELEMGRFLTEMSPFAQVAPVAGYVEYQAADGSVATLALLQAFVANQGDGWSYTIDFLERYLEDQRAEPGEAPKLQEEAGQAIYMTLISQLGARTAELHQALSRQTGDAWFDPEPVATAELEQWVTRVHAEAAQTLEKIAHQQAILPEILQADIDRLLMLREQMLAEITALVPRDLQTIKMRYHGDYHLGQVLVVQNDFVIIDFEGEPMRSLAERRGKHSPLKDVAGMLRSFSYAAYAALKRVTAEQPDDWAIYEPHARKWEQQVGRLFLKGYEAAALGAPHNPGTPGTRPLLKLFLLEKAFYELRYELDSRPDWVLIPLKGILDLVRPVETQDG
jgi:maltose alpha-D-glucosyltransferase/alpha-amylase